MTLRARLTVVYTVAAALLVAAVGFVVVSALRAGLTANLDAALRARASDVSSQLSARPNGPAAVEAVSGIVVQILGPNGTVLDGSDAVGDRPLASRSQVRSARNRDVVTNRTVPGPRGSERVFRVLVSPAGDRRVAVASDLAVVDRPVHRAERLLVAVSAVLVGAAGLGSWLQARAALRAVEHMRLQAQAMTIPGARRGIAVPGSGDELARLAATFNDLLRRLHAALERERAFAADAGHELRTPLTVLRGELELGIRPGRTPDELRGTIATAQRQTDRLVGLAEGLLLLVNVERAVVTRFDLRHMIFECADANRTTARQRGVAVEVGDGLPLAAVGDESALHRAVGNLIRNAIRFAPAGTTVEVSAHDGDAHWRVTVRDRGPGFPPAFLGYAFERFSQAEPANPADQKDTHIGAGLGLAIVAAVMVAHDGKAVASNRPGGGADVSISWPKRPVTSS